MSVDKSSKVDAKPRITLTTYLHRNLLVAKAIGIEACAKKSLGRLGEMKRAPKWMVKAMTDILQRAEPLPGELAHFRNLAPDNPYADHKNPLGPKEPPRPPNHREVA